MENKLIYLEEGQEALIQGSGKKPYTVKKTGGIVYCNCPAWLHQNLPTSSRACKHVVKSQEIFGYILVYSPEGGIVYLYEEL